MPDNNDLVSSDALPLPLMLLIGEQPPSDQLPLPLNRLLGSLEGVDNPDEPIEPEPPEYAPTMPNVSACFDVSYQSAVTIGRLVNVSNDGSLIAREYQARYTSALRVMGCFDALVKHFISLSNCAHTLTTMTYQLASVQRANALASILLVSQHDVRVSDSVGYSVCAQAYSAKSAHYQNCQAQLLTPTVTYTDYGNHSASGQHLAQCTRSVIEHAVSVPCRYYPIPELPIIPDAGVCSPRPPSDQLPLPLTRKRNGIPSDKLPLPLTCWNATTSIIIPALDTYIMHNVISATIGGIAVNPLSFNIKTDMESYCWSGSVSISPDDHARIKHKLDVPIGLEPMINVLLNDMSFAIIAENQSRTRKFGHQAHSLDGRSITARLGADYAGASDRLFDLASFASQIVNEQLADLPFTITDFGIADWLIPASTYAISNKTPIAVILDIADAAGGFVESHPFDATMSIKKRWKINAWDLATATPDVTIPADVIKRATDKTLKNTRYNTILLVGNVGHEVYRATQGRDVAAPTLSNALFTDQNVTIPKGSAVLSDSGTHSIQTLDLIFDDSIPLAELGQIWQINDTDGAWRGVIASVSIDCAVNNGVPEVEQTITIDRYMDN